jgi:hypothetical protein
MRARAECWSAGVLERWSENHGSGLAKRLDCGGFSTALPVVPVTRVLRKAALKTPQSKRFALSTTPPLHHSTTPPLPAHAR